MVEVMKEAMDLCSSYRYHEQVNIKFDFSDLINDMYSILSQYDESELDEFGLVLSPISVPNVSMSWEKDVFYDLKQKCFYSVSE